MKTTTAVPGILPAFSHICSLNSFLYLIVSSFGEGSGHIHAALPQGLGTLSGTLEMLDKCLLNVKMKGLG